MPTLPDTHVFTHTLSHRFEAGPHTDSVVVATPYTFDGEFSAAATVSITSFSDTVGGTAAFRAAVNSATPEIDNDMMKVRVNYTVLTDPAGVYIDELVFTVILTRTPQ